MELTQDDIDRVVAAALAEDVGSGDATTLALVPEDARCRAELLLEEPGVVCGIPVAAAVFRALDTEVRLEAKLEEGTAVSDVPVVLAVVEPEAVVLPASAADGVLLERPQAGRRLASVEDDGAGPVDRVHESPCQRRDSAEPAEQVEGRPLAGEDGAGRSVDPCQSHQGKLIAVCGKGLEARLRVERAKDGLDSRKPAHDARFFQEDVCSARSVGVDGRLGRHVAAPDVLGQGLAHDALEVDAGLYDHRSRAGGCPGRRTTWPASSGSSFG